MKLTAWFFSAVAALACAAGCGTDVGASRGSGARPVDTFRDVSFALPGALKLTRGDAVQVVVDAPDALARRVVTRVQDGVLGIYADGERGDGLDEVTVLVTFTELRSLAVSGSGTVTADDVTGSALTVAVSGSATVDLAAVQVESLAASLSGSGRLTVAALEAQSVASTVSGSGEVRLGGNTDVQAVTVSGSGGHIAEALEARTVEAMVSGSGRASVWATKSLDAVVAGSGGVTYRGQPKLTERVLGSGSIRRVDS